MPASNIPPVLTFDAALSQASKVNGKKHLLLGNGFSRACRNDIFAYEALFNQADFRQLSRSAREAFDALGTTDFEAVMRALRDTARIIKLYQPDAVELESRLMQDAEDLREVLARTIADNHPAMPFEIPYKRYQACRKFLSHFDNYFTLNYDLLLYWALMQDDPDTDVRRDDGFRTPEDGPAEYVVWDVSRNYSQNVYYLHGALHLYDAGSEIKKYTWTNTGIPLLDQIRSALHNGLFPLIVAEGESEQKLERIMHSSYLSRGYRRFAGISGTLFVYGHSMASNDEHWLRLIEKGKITQLFVGLYGDPDSKTNQHIIGRVSRMAAGRPRKNPLSVAFFDSASANVWGPPETLEGEGR